MDLINKQADLQKEAHEVLEKLQLIKILSKYGKPEIVGSLTLGLMTWRDIDITVISDKPNNNDIAELSAILIIKADKRLDLTLVDNMDGVKSHFPKGIYFGIKYFGHIPSSEKISSKSVYIWKIDLWFVTKENVEGITKTKEIKSKLELKNKQIILEIKNALWDHPLYKKDIKSMDIYDAVLEKGVKNLEEFKKYLLEKNIVLINA